MGFLFMLGFLAIAVIVLMVVSCWKIFEKAGYPGWYIFIPVYNVLMLARVAGMPWSVIVGLFGTQFVFSVLAGLVNTNPVDFLSNLAGWASLVVTSYCLARAFGGSVGLTLLNIFVPFVSYPLIAFTKTYGGFWETEGFVPKYNEENLNDQSGSNPFNRGMQPVAAASGAMTPSGWGEQPSVPTMQTPNPVPSAPAPAPQPVIMPAVAKPEPILKTPPPPAPLAAAPAAPAASTATIPPAAPVAPETSALAQPAPVAPDVPKPQQPAQEVKKEEPVKEESKPEEVKSEPAAEVKAEEPKKEEPANSSQPEEADKEDIHEETAITELMEDETIEIIKPAVPDIKSVQWGKTETQREAAEKVKEEKEAAKAARKIEYAEVKMTENGPIVPSLKDTPEYQAELSKFSAEPDHIAKPDAGEGKKQPSDFFNNVDKSPSNSKPGSDDADDHTEETDKSVRRSVSAVSLLDDGDGIQLK